MLKKVIATHSRENRELAEKVNGPHFVPGVNTGVVDPLRVSSLHQVVPMRALSARCSRFQCVAERFALL